MINLSKTRSFKHVRLKTKNAAEHAGPQQEALNLRPVEMILSRRRHIRERVTAVTDGNSGVLHPGTGRTPFAHPCSPLRGIPSSDAATLPAEAIVPNCAETFPTAFGNSRLILSYYST